MALNTYPWVSVWVVGHSALHLPKVRPSVSRSGLPFPPLVLSVCAWECYLVAFCWKRKGPRKETKIKKPFSNQIDPFSNQNDSDGISVFCLMTWHLIPYLWGWVWEVGHSALHFPTQYIQGEPFGTALPTIMSPVWVWAVLLKEEKREAIQSLREWDWWSRFDHHEPYGKCAVLKMTSNDPKMFYLLYFWTFWLLFVCLRPTTLRVGSYIYLHHLQSYLRSINRWGRAGGGGAIERTKPAKKKRELCETRGTKVGTWHESEKDTRDTTHNT